LVFKNNVDEIYPASSYKAGRYSVYAFEEYISYFKAKRFYQSIGEMLFGGIDQSASCQERLNFFKNIAGDFAANNSMHIIINPGEIFFSVLRRLNMAGPLCGATFGSFFA